MGVPTSEVGYTSAIPRREDHEVRKGHVGHWTKKKKKLTLYYPSNSKADARIRKVEATQRCLMYVPELISKSSEVYDRCDGNLLCGIQENNMVTVRRFSLAYVYTYKHTYRGGATNCANYCGYTDGVKF